MTREEIQEFFRPVLAKVGIPIEDVFEITLTPGGWEIHYGYRTGDGKFVFDKDLEDLKHGILRMKYTRP